MFIAPAGSSFSHSFRSAMFNRGVNPVAAIAAIDIAPLKGCHLLCGREL